MTEQLVAFLRGINLGKRNIKMAELREAFAGLGFADARTLIASGNVLFTATPAPDLTATLATGLEDVFGFPIGTIIRPVSYLAKLASSAPFADYPANDDTKFYVYFLARPETERISLPAGVPGDFEFAGQTGREIFAVAYRTETGRFGPGLDRFDKPFGADITNRNWNTILRLIDKAAS